MKKPTKVEVMFRKSRGRWVLRWPGHERYAEANTAAEAYREAFALEKQLNSGTVLSWAQACDLYEEMHRDEWSDDHLKTWGVVRRRFEAFQGVDSVADVTNTLLAGFASALTGKVSPTTIRTYSRYLTGFFRWCKYQEWIVVVPEFRLSRRKRGTKRARGRPLTTEEFERMLHKIPSVVGEKYAPSWEHFCKGLWESSLRLSEALNLHWSTGPVVVNAADKVIEFTHDKGGHSGLPITRDLWDLIEPYQRRGGHVFRPKLARGGETRSRSTVGHKVSNFGRAAGIIVGIGENGKKKFASAHDLRRSFAQAWRGKVPMETLQILMRHESSETTKRYYLGDEAKRVAATIWEE